jgi:hypothetical protein
MNFENLCSVVIEQKSKPKLKPLSGYDYYKSVRKSTPKTGTAFKDKSKYNRKEKYKKNIHESQENSPFQELIIFLKSKGIETADIFVVQEYITKIVNHALGIKGK